MTDEQIYALAKSAEGEHGTDMLAFARAVLDAAARSPQSARQSKIVAFEAELRAYFGSEAVDRYLAGQERSPQSAELTRNEENMLAMIEMRAAEAERSADGFGADALARPIANLIRRLIANPPTQSAGPDGISPGSEK